MRIQRLLTILAVLALMMLAPLAGLTSVAHAATLNVCPSGCPYSQIQPAIDAASNGDTIQIAAGTYNGGITVSKDLTLQGAGAGLTIIQGGGPVVTVNSGVIASIQGVKITGGNTSGGGGGILNARGTLTVTNSTISGDSAQAGGGIFTDSSVVTISNSTISGNTAGSYAGGIENLGSTLSVTSSTISGNTAGGYAGGIDNVSTMTVSNTIIAKNTANIAPDCHGTLADGPGGHNLLGNNSYCSGLANGANGDQVGTSTNPIDPRLGSLADNGGPTQTMALQAGSPAISAGDAITCESLVGPNGTKDTDQRGSARNSASRGACDVGAYDTGKTPTTDTTPPTCALSGVSKNAAGQTTAIQIAVQDSDGGLASIAVTELANATADVGTYQTGIASAPTTVAITDQTKGVVTVTANKVNLSAGASIALTAKDVAGNSVSCDPVVTAAVRADGKPVAQQVAGVSLADTTLTVLNDGDSVDNVTVVVNGHGFKANGLTAGQRTSLDISSALTAGTNSVSVTLAGKPGSTAAVLFGNI